MAYLAQSTFAMARAPMRVPAVEYRAVGEAVSKLEGLDRNLSCDADQVRDGNH